MSIKRSIKRNRKSTPNQAYAEAYRKGFVEGTKQQLENDIQATINILEKLEKADGIGEKTAEKVRLFFLDEMGVKEQ